MKKRDTIIFYPTDIIGYLCFWPCPWHVEVPGPGMEPSPPLCWILNQLNHQELFFLLSFFFFFFLGLHPWHMKIVRLAVELELQLPAHTTATAMQDLSLVCDLHHSS